MEEKMIKQLYHQYGKELFLYLYSMCQQKELAEDLLQETFLKAILALPEYHTNMRAWLYKVARNLFYNLYKRNRREICDEEYLKKISKLEVDEFLEEYISKQETRILYTAMQKLSPVKREVLELQYFGQMPLKEIANVLQLSQENVRVVKEECRRINQYKISTKNNCYLPGRQFGLNLQEDEAKAAYRQYINNCIFLIEKRTESMLKKLSV